VTTAGGFVPLILPGGDFWPPFAEVFAGGLLLTFVTFIFTPRAYKLLIARWKRVPHGPQDGAISLFSTPEPAA